MNTLARTKTVLAGISALTLLAVTACSGDEAAADDTDGETAAEETSTGGEGTIEAADEAVFNFEPEAQLAGQEFHVELPDHLLEIDGDYNDNRIIDSVTVRAAEHSDSQCAIEMSYHYAEGSQAQIEDDEWWDSSRYEPKDFRVPFEERTPDVLIDETKTVDERYSHIFDDTEGEAVFAEDRQSAIFPVACASSPGDGENTVGTSFRSFDVREGTNANLPGDDIVRNPITPTLATVEFNVMASGDIHVLDSSVNRYHFVGGEHGWLSDDQMVDSQGNVIDS